MLPASTQPSGSGYVNCDGEALLQNSDTRLVDESFEAYEHRMAEEAWAKNDDSADPEFFDDIALDKSGNLKDVSKLWRTQRLLELAIKTGQLVFNVGLIIKLDVIDIKNTKWLCTYEERRTSRYLITRSLIDPILTRIAQWLGMPHRGCSGHALPCIFELIGLATMIFAFVRLIVKSRTSSSKYERWYCTQRLFFESLPGLRNYSGMKLLHFCVPSIFNEDLADWNLEREAEVAEHHRCHYSMWKLFTLLLSRLLYLIIGLDTFMTKCAQNINPYTNKDVSFWEVIQVLTFMGQVLGIVQLNFVVSKYLYIFVFGREGGLMKPKEVAQKNAWIAMMTRAIFTQFHWFKALAVMTTFGGTDLHILIVDEKQREKHADPEKVN